MTESQVIAADVGNTSINLAARLGEQLTFHSIPIQGTAWPDHAVAWAESTHGNAPTVWRIASVHPDASTKLSRALETQLPGSHIQHLTWRDVPMKACVDEPDRLGIDRLLSAYGASRFAPSPIIVIDAGSAITVDWVCAEGEFHGGAILPGLQMQLRSLASGTASLPPIEWESTKIDRPGANTQQAMLTGVLAGIAGGIDRLVRSYRDFAGHSIDEVRVVLTGGNGAAISPLLDHNHEQHCNLVCRAVLDLPRSK